MQKTPYLCTQIIINHLKRKSYEYNESNANADARLLLLLRDDGNDNEGRYIYNRYKQNKKEAI
jgi:hypothetical protein